MRIVLFYGSKKAAARGQRQPISGQCFLDLADARLRGQERDHERRVRGGKHLELLRPFVDEGAVGPVDRGDPVLVALCFLEPKEPRGGRRARAHEVNQLAEHFFGRRRHDRREDNRIIGGLGGVGGHDRSF